jgi:hypothetical protein
VNPVSLHGMMIVLLFIIHCEGSRARRGQRARAERSQIEASRRRTVCLSARGRTLPGQLVGYAQDSFEGISKTSARFVAVEP